MRIATFRNLDENFFLERVGKFHLAYIFFVYRIYFFFATPKEKVAKRKGVRPAKKHPVSIAGGAHPCAPGLSSIQRDFIKSL